MTAVVPQAESPAPMVPPAAESHPMAEKPRTLWRDAWAKMRRNRTAMVCLVILSLYVIVGLAGFTDKLDEAREWRMGASNEPPRLYRTDPATGAKSLSPSLWIGTDFLGRSVMWRFLYGVRVALTVAILASIVEMTIGITLGAAAGFFGGWVDAIIIWLYSTVASVPYILLMIALAYVLQGQAVPAPWTDAGEIPLAGIPTIVLALGLTSWVGLCRLIRAEVLKHRERDYVVAARAMGVSNTRIIFRHIFPNVFHIVIINFSLGLGVTDRPSWGRMIDDAKLELLKGVWWQMAAATAAIFVFSLCVNIFGDALRDALDPRLRGTD